MHILMIAPEPFFEPRGTPFSEYHRIRALTSLGHTVDLVTYPFGRDVELPGLRIFRCAKPPFISHVKIGPSWAKVPLNLLLTVTGVGPKVALAIVGSRPTADLQLAIMTGDQAVLVAIPGIGKKLAERVIFELKEKVAAAGVAASAGSVAGIGGAESEVVAALQALGYSNQEAREASKLALADPTIGGTLEDRVKAALRTLLRD